MPEGSLFITVRASNSAVPVEGAKVTVTDENGVRIGKEEVTDANGVISGEYFLAAPNVEYSLSPEKPVPYSLYNVRVEAAGFYTLQINGVQIFAGEKSALPVEMIPQGEREGEVLTFDIGPHALRLTSERRLQGPGEDERILGRVFIPESVIVHLGTPSSNASNVRVPFVDYIKNVASSEIYPTWPRESLRANILCQISFILNRIFTEWYPSRGYNFNITNSTAFDQYFVYGRNIYDSVSKVVDEIFNQYIRRPGRIDPYFAEYCNGSSVTCAGLSQWGTVTLANDGRSALEILQFYYGNVEIAETNEIRAVESSYPGSPLRVGSSGEDVRTIQQQLNRIRVNYPAIPAIINVDGIFGQQTRNAVLAFQRVFDLTEDGVVGKSTWYRISYIYVAVKKLAELNSEGELPQYNDNRYPGLLRFGDTGTAVQTIQFYLKTIAAFNPFLRSLAVDGFFGRGTENAVIAFQRYYGLTPDGLVGETTWNLIVQIYQDITEGGTITIRPYPGTPLDLGSSGGNVLYVQKLLNRIRRTFVTIPRVEEDSEFGRNTRNAVREFQRVFGLELDGIVGSETWNALNRVFGSSVAGCLSGGEAESGRVLRYGSSGADVSRVQRNLNTVARSIAIIPRVAVDGNFGRNTERSVKAFQSLAGLTSDGIVGNATRTRLSTFAAGVEAGCLPLIDAREREFSSWENSSFAKEDAFATNELFPIREEKDASFSAFHKKLPWEEEFFEEELSFGASSLWPEDCPWKNEEDWDQR